MSRCIRAASSLAGLVVLFADGVLAAPNLWQQAAEPRLRHVEAVKRAAQRAREPRAIDLGSGAILGKLNQRAAVAIQLAGGAELGDVELQYLLGHCLTHASGGHFVQAFEVLQRVLRRAPNHPLAARGWRDLAQTAAALNRFDEETRAYRQALALEWRTGVRSEMYLERGLSHMARGDLGLALNDFAAASEQAAVPEQWAFAQWSLAVALDRFGNSPRATERVRVAAQARFGPAGRLTVLQTPVARFRVSYDLHYYMALERMAVAQAASDDALRSAALQAARLMWLRYLDAASPLDPWRTRVGQHLERIARQQASDEADDDLDAQALEPMQLED